MFPVKTSQVMERETPYLYTLEIRTEKRNPASECGHTGNPH